MYALTLTHSDGRVVNYTYEQLKTYETPYSLTTFNYNPAKTNLDIEDKNTVVSAKIGTRINTIGYCFFNGCNNLSFVDFGVSGTPLYIDDYAFSGCAISSVSHLCGGNQGRVAILDGKAFYGNPISNLDINGIYKMGRLYAFDSDYMPLSTLNISNVPHVGAIRIENSANAILSSITLSNVIKLSSIADNKGNLDSVALPSTLKAVGQIMGNEGNNIAESLPNRLVSIGNTMGLRIGSNMVLPNNILEVPKNTWRSLDITHKLHGKAHFPNNCLNLSCYSNVADGNVVIPKTVNNFSYTKNYYMKNYCSSLTAYAKYCDIDISYNISSDDDDKNDNIFTDLYLDCTEKDTTNSFVNLDIDNNIIDDEKGGDVFIRGYENVNIDDKYMPTNLLIEGNGNTTVSGTTFLKADGKGTLNMIKNANITFYCENRTFEITINGTLYTYYYSGSTVTEYPNVRLIMEDGVITSFTKYR